jgi:hypothetical protein
MYLFPDKINNKIFFRMNRDLVLKKHWAALPPSSKAIYPVIAVHADAKGKAFPSQETIGAIAGCTPKTVRDGIAGLMGFPGWHLDHWTTTRRKRACSYFITPAPQKKGMTIRLAKAFFEGQNWSNLSSTAQAVYPVMLAFSYLEFQVFESINYAEGIELELEANEFFTNGEYEKRDFDVAEPDYHSLAESAGISYRSVKSALQSLEENYFIAPTVDDVGNEYWKVFRLPPYSF